MKYKDFFQDLLVEYTESTFPEAFDILKKEKDELTGIHFSDGLAKRTPTGKLKFPGAREHHLSFNLNPGHSDPLGVYVFPKSYVLSGQLKQNRGWWGRQHWFVIRPIRSKCKILNLSTMTKDEMVDLLNTMEIDEKHLNYIYAQPFFKNRNTKPGEIFWITVKRYIYDEVKGRNFTWNKLFKKTGYNVILDDGDGIIFSGEDAQLIYLEPGTFEVISRGHYKTNKKALFDIIKAFPGWAVSNTTNNRTSRDKAAAVVIKLRHPSTGIVIQLVYEPMDELLNVAVYGMVDRFNAAYSNEDPESPRYSGPIDSGKIIKDIKDFISSSKIEQSYSTNKLTDDSKLMKKISERYKLALNPQNFRSIVKRYTHRDHPVKFELRAYDKVLEITLERRRSYSSYNYYYAAGIDFTQYDNNIELIMKAVFLALENQIESSKPYTIDWAFEENKADALKTVKFLKDRVFAPRK